MVHTIITGFTHKLFEIQKGVLPCVY